ncbi:hypothetical protein SPRG_09422 [Saprolegnia parasitica CBS 223.65]|uniref:Uncharacterized protein n=1 Tax=Saprolegnia parasitica (strain CBS 223.65) TaxID=695850 RepID=A0A067C3V6_SAPPC|nr:hypothetical protein SPRG_09422 [Saprolegnia parasitica CBS 223.65]KDO25479.1 hypothetical protein SPRG_09422 [Saprolegnia parasitica CBS 223.65]|eukprot:XP_012203904.1 hypothetical protein SPRG_09422 [Saprolegnia parasitica CBS 223.65]
MLSPSKSRAAYDVLTLPSLATIIFAYQGTGVSMSLALAFRKHKTKLRQLFSRPMNNEVETFRGYVLCKLVAAKDVKLALELLAAFPERDMLALPPTNKKYVYAIDNAVRLQSVPLLTKLLERDFGKSSKAAMDAAAADGNLAMVQLLHEYRDDGCTHVRAMNAFQALSSSNPSTSPRE